MQLSFSPASTSVFVFSLKPSSALFIYLLFFSLIVVVVAGQGSKRFNSHMRIFQLAYSGPSCEHQCKNHALKNSAKINNAKRPLPFIWSFVADVLNISVKSSFN